MMNRLTMVGLLASALCLLTSNAVNAQNNAETADDPYARKVEQQQKSGANYDAWKLEQTTAKANVLLRTEQEPEFTTYTIQVSTPISAKADATAYAAKLSNQAGVVSVKPIPAQQAVRIKVKRDVAEALLHSLFDLR